MRKNNTVNSLDNTETKNLYHNTIQFIIREYSTELNRSYHQKDIAKTIGVDASMLSKFNKMEVNANMSESSLKQMQNLIERMIERYGLKIIFSIEVGNNQSFKVPAGKERDYLERLRDPELAVLLSSFIEYIIDKNTKKGQRRHTQNEIAKVLATNSTELSRLKNEEKGYTKAQRLNCIGIIEKIKRKYKEVEIYCTITVANCPLQENRSLHKLAHKLALNLIDVSTPFEEQVNPHKEIIQEKESFGIPIAEDREKERFILVAGAGASHAATKKYIPLGMEAAEEIRKRIVKRIPGALIEAEIDRLRYSYRLPPDEFETKILAYSKYGRKEVIEALREICGYAYIPSLSYEIIAHMFKHRFIDSIINFNYDEVLDVAVKEELQQGDFKFIYSDADCPGDYKELLINDRLRQPVYIKPHGTISHRSSLRFTREDFFSIPPEIRATMKDLLDASVIEQNKQQPYLKLNLILVGYSLTNFEFIRLIQEYLEKRKKARLTIWVFDTHLQLDEIKKEFEKKDLDRIEIVFFDLLMKHSLEDYLLTLWRLVEGNFKDHYKPRGIERHELVNHIFNFDKEELKTLGRGEKLQKKAHQRNYFLGRFYVELIIAYLQSDGILNAKQILEDRAGDYFHLYLESGGVESSLRDHCGRLGLKVYKDFIWDTYILEKPPLFYEKEELYDFLLERLKNCIPRNFVTSLRGIENQKRFQFLCQKIRVRNIAKITPNFVFPHNHLFSKIKKEDILNTAIAWIYRFQEAIHKSDKWDVMLSISEKGRFLKKLKKGLIADKKIELVLASFDTNELDDLKKNDFDHQKYGLTGKLNFLPWWLHNQHLVLLMKRTNKNTGDWTKDWQMFEGFYYESRLLSRRVNPIHIKDSQDDLQILLYIFANYWYRAKSYTESKDTDANPAVPIIPNKNSIERIIKELLSKYDESDPKNNDIKN